MNGITIAIIANVLLAVSLVIDKSLLTKRVAGSPFVYAFWISILNIVVFALIPFGFSIPSLKIVLLALLGSVAFVFATIAFFRAIDAGEASPTFAIVGGFAPIATLLIGNVFGLERLNISDTIAFVFLTAGGFLLFLSEKPRFKKIFIWTVLAAFFFGLGNVIQKVIFEETDFITGLVTVRGLTVPVALAFLISSKLRKQVFRNSRISAPSLKLGFLGNRVIVAGAMLLLAYAIHLEHPAIVEAVSGIRYILIFLIVAFFARFAPSIREVFRGWTLVLKIFSTGLVLIGLLGISLQTYYERLPVPEKSDVRWGVTFSTKMADNQFGLHWKSAYRAILNDLKPDGIRVVAYWDDIELMKDAYDFSKIDFQMNEAEKAGVPVVLVIGQKVPRWPECHVPEWAEQLTDDKGQLTYKEELLDYLAIMVVRYKDHPALQYWQVENEPFLKFGECDHKAVASLVSEEVSLVKSFDSEHPVLITDGGEFGDWYRAAKRGDIFGTTLYRRVHNDRFGNFVYLLMPEFYPLKKDVVQFFTRNPEQRFVAIEVGLESWNKKQLQELSHEDQMKFFTISDFKEDIEYARRARFNDYYMWGVEWWYYMKTVHNHDEYWELAKEIINN